MNKDTQVTVRFPSDLLAQAKAAALLEGRSVGSYVRRAVARTLAGSSAPAGGRMQANPDSTAATTAAVAQLPRKPLDRRQVTTFPKRST